MILLNFVIDWFILLLVFFDYLKFRYLILDLLIEFRFFKLIFLKVCLLFIDKIYFIIYKLVK